MAESSPCAPPRVHRVAITLLCFIRLTHNSPSTNSHLISDLWPRQLINKSVTLGTSVFTHSSVKSGAARCKDDCAALSFVSKRWGWCRSVPWLICDRRAWMINLYDMSVYLRRSRRSVSHFTYGAVWGRGCPLPSCFCRWSNIC